MRPWFFPLKTDETNISLENWWTPLETDETLVFAIENSGVRRKSSLRLIFGIWTSPLIMN